MNQKTEILQKTDLPVQTSGASYSPWHDDNGELIFERVNILKDIFDDEFYLTHNADVAELNIPALEHFLNEGWKERRNISHKFNRETYLKMNPDVSAEGSDPVVHFCLYGFNENRQLFEEDLDEHKRHALKTFFDPDFYLSKYQDIKNADCDAIEHYHFFGWKEGRDPSAAFDTSFYLERYKDVADSNINPLLHYAYTGKKEGRLAKESANQKRRNISVARSASAKSRDWLIDIPENEVRPTNEFLERLSEVASDVIIFSFSHDDYISGFGGVQNVIAEEARVCADNGYTYIHVRPAQPLPILADAAERNLVAIRINGKAVGIFDSDALEGAETLLHEHSSKIFSIIHHLMGFSPEKIAQFLAQIPVITTYLWVHDYFTICPNYNLLRNDFEYCGAPPITSHACQICCYGYDRMKQEHRIQRFIEAVGPKVIAPSNDAYTRWHALSSSSNTVGITIPLAEIFEGENIFSKSISEHQAIKVAYLGRPIYNKGWHVFQKLVDSLHDDGRYKFYCLGVWENEQNKSENVTFVPTQVSSENPQAMIEALVSNEIDVIVNWPTWPETFNFTAYEGLAAGCVIVTNSESGNVWSAVQQYNTELGIKLSDEKALLEYFSEGRIFEKSVTERRVSELRRTKATISLIESELGS